MGNSESKCNHAFISLPLFINSYNNKSFQVSWLPLSHLLSTLPLFCHQSGIMSWFLGKRKVFCRGGKEGACWLGFLFYFLLNVLYICVAESRPGVYNRPGQNMQCYSFPFSHLCKTRRMLHYLKGRTDLSVTRRAWLMYVSVVPGTVPQRYKCNRGSTIAWH